MGVNTAWAVLIFVLHTAQPHTQELTAPSTTFFQGPDATWLWSGNQSCFQAHPAGWGCGSDTMGRGLTQDQILPAPNRQVWTRLWTSACSTAVMCSSIHGGIFSWQEGRSTTAPDPNPTVTALERTSPAKLLKMQHSLSELLSKTAGACIWEVSRKEARKYSGVLATDYWTNRE